MGPREALFVKLLWPLVLFVTLSNDEVCDNGNGIKQYNFQNSYGVIESLSLCTYIQVFLWNPKFFPMGNFFLPKITIFGLFWVSKATFLNLQRCKNRLRGNIPLGQIYTKITIFWRFFGAVSPRLLSHNREIWREVVGLGLSPNTEFCKKNCLREYLYQKRYKRGSIQKQTKTSHVLVYSRRATHDPHHTWHDDRGDTSRFCTP